MSGSWLGSLRACGMRTRLGLAGLGPQPQEPQSQRLPWLGVHGHTTTPPRFPICWKKLTACEWRFLKEPGVFPWVNINKAQIWS